MDVKYINPFIESTYHVLETMAKTRAEGGNPYIKKDRIARGVVSAVIELSGDVSGTISISFEETCILNIVSNLFNEKVEMNDEIKDTVGELCNIITGQARQKLNELGLNIQAGIPRLITGENHSINHISDRRVMGIPFTCADSNFTIEVCVE
ncbi:MAG: chemotaxis protein CheX [Deltaproteobacteria bacterium]|nr:chemotaxis protein CheX [Deltaproteobacteria bacterium]